MASRDKDPTRVFTRGIPEAVTGGPFYERSLQGGGLVPSTWGDCASRLVEADLVEPTVEAVCDFLFIEPSDLSDPRVYFTDSFIASGYFSNIKKRWEEEFAKEYGEQAKVHDEYLQNKIQTDWTAPEDADAQAKGIQSKISELLESRRGRQDADPDAEVSNREIDLMCLKRDALYSGVAVPMDTFAQAVLGDAEDPFFTPTERAKALSEMIEDDRNLREVVYDYPDIPASDVIIGEDQIDEYRMCLKAFWRDRQIEYVETKWGAVKPIFIAPSYKELPLFTGTEQ